MTTYIEKESLIGKRVPKLDAPAKVSGETRYVHDLELPGMLVGKILRSDRVHARIVSIDTRAARALPGVHAVITAADTPGVALGRGRDNPPLKGERVRCIREEIAAVAAESESIADRALELIEVQYENLPAVFSPVDALKPGAPVIHDHHRDNTPLTWDYAQGDIAAGEADMSTWWSVLNDPGLDSLIERAGAGNLDLRQAVDRIAEARAQLGIAAWEFFPDVDAVCIVQLHGFLKFGQLLP